MSEERCAIEAAGKLARSSTIDEAKFKTQKMVTYLLLAIFAATTAWVMHGDDQSERSMVLQTVINLTLLAVGYWLGASKAAADSTNTMGKLAEAAAPTQERAVAAARAPASEEAIVPAAATTEPAVTPAPTNPETGVVPAKEVVTEPRP